MFKFRPLVKTCGTINLAAMITLLTACGGETIIPENGETNLNPGETTTSSGNTSTAGTNSSTTSSTNSSSSDGLFRVNSQGNITKNGAEIPMNCGSWFGLEGRHEPSNDEDNPGGAPMELFVGNMWWANNSSGTGRTISQTMSEITAMGVNVVRLPIAPQTLDRNDPQGQSSVFKNHESVRSNNSREALEEFIRLADQNNIELIIDIHSCSNYVGWRAGRLDAAPPYVDKDRENYDFTREDYSCGNAGSGVTVHAYNEQKWLENLREIAGLADELGVDNILGIDIFNEPWDYTWDEWKTLSEKAYEAINEVNSDVLIVVEGIGAGKSDGTDVPHGKEELNPNWGENFYEASDKPLNIPKDRLVLSPHTYGPSVYVQKQFMDPNDSNCVGLEGDAAGDAKCNIVIQDEVLKEGWEEHFGFLREEGYAILIGEFGGNMQWPQGAADDRDRDRWGHIQPGVDEEWQNTLVDYMIEKEIPGCYWSINPESGDTGGWYEHVYDPRSNKAGWGEWKSFDNSKTNLLKRLWDK